MKNHKFSAFIKFDNKRAYQEFSNSINRLEKMIHTTGVVRVEIYEQLTKDKTRKLITITKNIHI